MFAKKFYIFKICCIIYKYDNNIIFKYLKHYILKRYLLMNDLIKKIILKNVLGYFK